MIRLYAPVAVAVVAILGFSAWEAVLSDRFTSSTVTAEEFGKRFKNVPYKIGDWEGSDQPIEKATLEMAGAVSHVSRRYVNPRYPGQHVDLWLIVGHAREICRHTPDLCYPSQGYAQLGSRIKHKIEPPGDPDHPGMFFTAKFRNESIWGTTTERVFWAWNGNEEGRDEWEAPEYQKLHFGNNRALYKMYFTSPMLDDDEETGKNLAVEFGKLAMPIVNRALFPERYKGEPAPVIEGADEAPTLEELETTETPELEAPIGEAPAAEAPAEGAPAEGN